MHFRSYAIGETAHERRRESDVVALGVIRLGKSVILYDEKIGSMYEICESAVT